MCPIVPTFTCGLLRSNFSFAIALFLFLGFKPVLNLSLHRIRLHRTNPAKSLAQSILRLRSAGLICRSRPGTVRENVRNPNATSSNRTSYIASRHRISPGARSSHIHPSDEEVRTRVHSVRTPSQNFAHNLLLSRIH